MALDIFMGGQISNYATCDSHMQVMTVSAIRYNQIMLRPPYHCLNSVALHGVFRCQPSVQKKRVQWKIKTANMAVTLSQSMSYRRSFMDLSPLMLPFLYLLSHFGF